MSGPRLVYPHFSPAEAELMADMASGEEPWVHKKSSARAHERNGVPTEEIQPMDYIILRRDMPASSY